MPAPTTHRVLDAVRASGVRYELAQGWDDPQLQAPGVWAPEYVLLHHTANGGAQGDAPSLGWCVRGTYPPVRNCHFLVARSGLVHVVYALGAYHAGQGGPGAWGGGPRVPRDTMNHRAYGIEIESAGMSLDTSARGGTDGITPAQLEATARLTAALLDMLDAGTGRAINHRTWAPTRKVDTRMNDAAWHTRIDQYRSSAPAPARPTMGDDSMTILRTNNGMGRHYLISGGVAAPLDSGYTIDQLGDASVITLAAGDRGAQLLAAFGVK